jgi:hypothetical protein
MAQLSLRLAAQETGTSKTTILRAVKAGRLSATRDDKGGYQIDPAELHRVYPPDRLVPRNAVQNAAGSEVEILVRCAALGAENQALRDRLEAEVGALREHLDAERRRADEIRQERDVWRGQFERLQLAAPIVTPPPPSPNQNHVVPIVPPAPRMSWWRWLRQTG